MYFRQHFIDLVRLVGYEGLPVAQPQAKIRFHRSAKAGGEFLHADHVIGAHQYSAEEVWEDVKLLRGSTVVAFTCYGGGGEGAATGEFGSVASLALRAGARAAVASRWPAWVLPATAGHYEALFAALRDGGLDPDRWRVASDVMQFMYAMRAHGPWNALGWGVCVPAGGDRHRPAD
jgi:hypothetical protein